MNKDRNLVDSKSDQATPIWKKRRQAFNKEALGYWLYVLRSNFVGYVFLLLIGGIYYYVKVLDNLPRDYPYWWVAMLVFVPLLAMSSIRTFLVQPDRMFLLPLEGRLEGFFRAAIRHSMLMQSISTTFGLLAVWPLYLHCEGAEAQPLWLVLLLLLISKWASLLSNWQESRMVSRNARTISSLLRWGVAALLIPIAFIQGVMWAALLLLVVALIWVISLRGVRQQATGWETLIEREQATRRRHYRFFSMFVDVSPLPPTVRRRGLASIITKGYKFTHLNTHLYLYTKTWLRTDLFSMFIRTTLAALLVVIVVSSDGVRITAAIIGMIISALQLSTLRDAHRYTFWLNMYPLQPTQQVHSIIAITQLALAAQALCFALAILIRATNSLYAIAPLLVLGLLSLYYHFILKRKWKQKLLSD